MKLTVLERAEDHVTPSGKTHPRYRCRCSCGDDQVFALGHNLTSWRKQTCGDREKHPIVATGPKSDRMPRAFYIAAKIWQETGNDSAYLEFVKAWKRYQSGRGPKP